jgi:hypothetical protein
LQGQLLLRAGPEDVEQALDVWRVLTLVVWLLLLVICVVLVRVLENEGMLNDSSVLIHFILLTASSK